MWEKRKGIIIFECEIALIFSAFHPPVGSLTEATRMAGEYKEDELTNLIREIRTHVLR